MPNRGDPLRGEEPAWRAVHPPECPARPWGYGARPSSRPAPGAGSRGLQLIVAAAAGAGAYAYYHKLYGYPCERPKLHRAPAAPAHK